MKVNLALRLSIVSWHRRPSQCPGQEEEGMDAIRILNPAASIQVRSVRHGSKAIQTHPGLTGDSLPQSQLTAAHIPNADINRGSIINTLISAR